MSATLTLLGAGMLLDMRGRRPVMHCQSPAQIQAGTWSQAFMAAPSTVLGV